MWGEINHTDTKLTGMSFRELSKRMKVLSNGLLLEMIEDILNELEQDIVQMNREQLREGQKADESYLPPYSLNTTMNRETVGLLVALHDTGDFWNSFFSTASLGLLEIDAKDRKRDMLIEIWGEQILGLTPDNHKILLNKIAERLKVKTGEYLQQ